MVLPLFTVGSHCCRLRLFLNQIRPGHRKQAEAKGSAYTKVSTVWGMSCMGASYEVTIRYKALYPCAKNYSELL